MAKRKPPGPKTDSAPTPSDSSPVRVSVVSDPLDNVVTVQFNRKVSWLNLTIEESLELADEIRRCAQDLAKPSSSDED